MKIATDHSNIITFSSIEGLRKFQVSQLEYYGYENRGSEMVKWVENIEFELQKVVGYLDDEGIDYELSDEISLLLTESAKEEEKLLETFELAKSIKDGNISVPAFKEFNDFTNTLPRTLKPHQLKSAFHFYILKNGANFSVPGSGKTTTILAVYEKLKLEGVCNVLYVVGPPSCFQPWQSEFVETIGRVPDTMILSGGDRSFRKSEYYRSSSYAHELYLSTFHTALNDVNDIRHFLSQPGIKAMLIVDEAHYMKQLGGSWAESLLRIGRKATVKGILTGTPMPKSYKDLFNLFDFLWEQNSPLSEDDKIQIGIWEKQKQDVNVKELLSRRVGSLFYRVRKNDLGLLPARFHDPIKVPMNKIERKIYNSIKAKIFELDQLDYFKNETLLNKLWKGRMIRLRQCISHPTLLLSAIDNYSEKLLDDSELQYQIQNYKNLEVSAKITELEKLVLNLRSLKQKVLIWSNFIGTIELIKSHFSKIGHGVEVIYGKTPIRKDDKVLLSEEKTREDIRDEFLDLNSGLDILVANPGACAESISLHKSCFHAVYFDLSYNGAQFLQSLDRIHRVGGSESNQANYYFLEYEDSIDQDIKRNLDSKAQKMYDIIEEDYGIYNLDLFDESNDEDIEAYSRLFNKN